GSEVDAPVVERDGDVEEQGVDAGEIEVEDAGQRPLDEHDVVAEEIAVYRRARQGRVRRRAGKVTLEVELVFHERRLLARQVRHDDRNRLAPPREAAQVRLY